MHHEFYRSRQAGASFATTSPDRDAHEYGTEEVGDMALLCTPCHARRHHGRMGTGQEMLVMVPHLDG
jgi:hypothetical protein